MIKISFVIPAYNEEGYIRSCLDAIVREINGRDGYEIIVVNNNSNDKTREIAAGYPTVTVVDEEKKGIVFARRAGFMASHGDLIANIDADTMITPGWIDTASAEFEKNRKLVALSGPFTYYDLPKTMQTGVRFFYYMTYSLYLLSRFVLRTGSVVQGGNFIVRRSALQAIGGYDISIAFYGEDTDIARRMSKIGDVKFTFALPALTSGRRLAKEGTFTIGLRYTLNYFWIVLFNKPFTMTSTEVRFTDQKITYRPESRIKEWIIALGAIVVAFAIIEVLIYAFSRFRL